MQARANIWHRPPLQLALLGLLALAATAWALDAPFYFDSISRIALNPDLRDISHLLGRLIYPPSEQFNFDRNDPSRPVVFAIWGLIHFCSARPAAFRLLNLALHLLNTLLIYFLGCALLPTEARERRVSAVVAAALFAVSPVNAGTAIYTYAATNLLALTFSLLTLLSFALARTTARPLGALTGLCLVLGIFANQSVAVMPAVLLVYELLLPLAAPPAWRRQRPTAHALLWAMVAAYLAWRLLYFGQLGDVEGTTHLWSRSAYLAAQGEVILRYLALLVVPLPGGLSIDHQFGPIPPAEYAWRVVLPWLVVLCLVLALLRLAWRRSPTQRACAAALCWFVLQLLPTSSIMPTVDAMVERRVYAASPGFYIFLALALATLWRRFPARLSRFRLPAGATLVASIICAFLLISVGRSRDFRDPVATWSRTLAQYPRSVRALSNLGAAYLQRKAYARARELFQRAGALQEGSFSSWFNLGAIYENPDSGFYDLDQAIAMYRRTLANNPGYGLVYFRLARLLQMRGDLDGAKPLYEASLRAGLELVPCHNNLGVIFANRGDRDAARREFLAALALDPGYAQARESLRALEQGKLAAPAGSPP